ncbi:cobalamin biosynthesis protein CobD, partial [Carbonactinospora thermoautotrophica]
MSSYSRSTGLLVGLVLDAYLADPRRAHPVALFGRAAATLERRVWADSRLRGAAHAGACVAGATALGALLARASQR